MECIFQDKWAWVGGGSQGIGKATAMELARSGANVVLMARNEVSLQEVLDELPRSNGQKHDFLASDFSNTSMLKEAVDRKVSEIGEAHILVNNTGGPPPGPAHKASIDEYLNAFKLHLIANQCLATALIPLMKSAEYGRIINIISTSVKQPLQNLGVSNTVRGAVANWAKTLANELGGFGITVNNVLPGATATGRLDAIIGNKASKSDISTEEAAKSMKSAIPAGRFASPAELAYAVCFLASDKAAYINGINVPVDGGRTSSL